MVTDRTLEKRDKFTDMNLPSDIVHGIFKHGFLEPSAIQQMAIVPISSGRNVIAQAQSGTGKTGAFIIGLLTRIDPTIEGVQALILAPTRELAKQIEQVANSISQFLNGIHSHCAIGGQNVTEDRDAIRTSSILIGTPGRIKQLVCPKELDNRVFVSLKNLKVIIFDEADEMLDKGFREDTSKIFNACPMEAQVVLVSATFNDEVKKLCNEIAKDSVKILVKEEELTLEGIDQVKIEIDPKDKEEALIRLLRTFMVNTGIIYVESKESCDKIYTLLEKNEMPVKKIHGSMEQKERNNVMKDFRNGNTRYLVTTNLLARGIDIQNLGIVINYDLPKDNASYLHRVGRSGRFGKKGLAINMICDNESLMRLNEIESAYATKIEDFSRDLVNKWNNG